jgi:hypothetical protein
MTTPLPIEHFYDLSDLSSGGAEIRVAANDDQRKKLAEWLEVESVEKFESLVSLKKLSANRYRYEAKLDCDLVQPSVLTLDPLRTHIAEAFTRELHVAHRLRRGLIKDEELTLAAGDDDAPEEIENTVYDLAGPLLEELSLALDPYPKGTGETFSPPGETEPKPENPFAVLKGLKDKG